MTIEKPLRTAILILVVWSLIDSFHIRSIERTVFAQGPTVSQSYGLTLERDDFPPAIAVAGPAVFQTVVQTRSSFAIVYRNGILQRPCGVPTGPCDYAPSGNVTVTYPPNVIQAGDQVTVFFYR
jgi:hypothetical protein